MYIKLPTVAPASLPVLYELATCPIHIQSKPLSRYEAVSRSEHQGSRIIQVRRASIFQPTETMDYNVLYFCTETENCIHFWAERCQKYALFQKKVQIKVFRHRISYKKVRQGMSISPGVELEGSKDDMVEILNCTEMENCIHFQAERCQKLALLQKKAPYKSFSASNFIQKSPPGHISTSSWSGARGSKDDMVEILNCTEMENEKKFCEQLLFVAFFGIMCILGSVQPKMNVFFHFCTISYLNQIIFRAPQLHSIGRQRYALADFFVGNSML